MAAAVWILYATDRLLDARPLIEGTEDLLFNPHPQAAENLEARHLFHHRHRRLFRLGILVAAILLTTLLPTLPPASIRLYLILGALLLAYFLLIHTPNLSSTPSSLRPHRIPKELAVGLFFSAATFIPTISREPALRLELLPAALLFALLCSLNCLFIYKWEHDKPSHPRQPAPNPATRIALRLLHPSTVLTIATAAALAVLPLSQPYAPWPIPAAIALAATLLLLLDRSRNHLAPTTLRAAADLCLLTPLLFLR